MRTAGRPDREVPAPQSAWDEVLPGLWMGGHVWADGFGHLRPAVVDREFGLVVSLHTQPGHGPPPDVRHEVREIPDGPLSPAEIDAVHDAAALTAAAVRAGRRTLVRCFAGYNRSGLVTARAVCELTGVSAPRAVELVRRRRSPWALHNDRFVGYLETGLEVAYLLEGLSSA
ncbi:protein phosphatase [Streptomyces sp. CC53]|uniref:dual specificity protein phosphatase family protein n=1 Tax=unclassified Streptomyces TaxID=2593676 RepID=UPI0008DC6109|nr:MULTISPECIES: dual specificity protein phosphatase family protein [unclassified Streptomyces]OII65428.1 protein phosphatase [Streptomyces sp. CC53]